MSVDFVEPHTCPEQKRWARHLNEQIGRAIAGTVPRLPRLRWSSDPITNATYTLLRGLRRG